MSPDIVVQQPPRVAETAEDEEEETESRLRRSEADLRGALSNDSLSDDEQDTIREEQEAAEKAAQLREEDYQLAYAIDILKGFLALVPSE